MLLLLFVGAVSHHLTQVSLQLLKVVDLVKGEEIAATTAYHRLTKENSELLRRYCFYLKLKIHQL